MKNLFLLFGLILFSTQVLAADEAQAVGNPEDGQAKAQNCMACHGRDGNSASDMNPKLAGQHAGYLVKQLQDFKLAFTSNGAEGRASSIMGGMANALSEQDMKDIAAYYASQELKIGATPEDAVEAGQALYRGGDPARGITACAACHGPDGKGMNLAGFPAIGGQHIAYNKTQLENFRSEARANDLNAMMRNIAVKLTDADIKVLSEYLAGLH